MPFGFNPAAYQNVQTGMQNVQAGANDVGAWIRQKLEERDKYEQAKNQQAINWLRRQGIGQLTDQDVERAKDFLFGAVVQPVPPGIGKVVRNAATGAAAGMMGGGIRTGIQNFGRGMQRAGGMIERLASPVDATGYTPQYQYIPREQRPRNDWNLSIQGNLGNREYGFGMGSGAGPRYSNDQIGPPPYMGPATAIPMPNASRMMGPPGYDPMGVPPQAERVGNTYIY